MRTEKIGELLLAIRSKIVCWLTFAGRVLLREVEHAACTKGMMSPHDEDSSHSFGNS